MANEANLIQNFIGSSDTVICLKDEQGRFLMVNRAFAETFKVSKEQILGKNDYDIASKEQAEEWRALDRQVAESGSPMNFTSTIAIPGGEIKTIDHKFPVSGIEGFPNAVGGIAIKISDSE